MIRCRENAETIKLCSSFVSRSHDWWIWHDHGQQIQCCFIGWKKATKDKKKTTTPIFIEYFLIHLKPEFLLWTRNWIHLSKKEVEKKRYVSLTDGFLIIIGTYINKQTDKREKKRKRKNGSERKSFSGSPPAAKLQDLQRYPRRHINTIMSIDPQHCPEFVTLASEIRKRLTMQMWISCSFCHIKCTFQNTLSVCTGWNCIRENKHDLFIYLNLITTRAPHFAHDDRYVIICEY